MSLHGPSSSRSLYCSGGAKPGRVHRVQAHAPPRQRLARGAEIDQHRRAVVADVDVGRLDVQVQQLVRVHFAQPVQQLREHVADEVLLDRAAARLDVLLQRAAALVAHHQVDGLVGAEEIQHPHHVGVRQARERAAFLEEALHAVAEGREVLVGDRRQRVALACAARAGWEGIP